MRTIIGCLILIVSTPPGLVGQQTTWTRSTREVVEAKRSGGLPAAANVVGHYNAVEEDDFEGTIANLYGLAVRSDVVVSARITDTSSSQLSANSQSIFTDMQLTVQDAFKGPIPAGNTLTFRMRGGRIQFSNGTTAELKSLRNPPLAVGDEAVFFLMRLPNESDLYEATYGSQGLFVFDVQARVRSRARRTDEVFKNYNGLSRSEFLAQVRSATGM